MVVYLLVVKKDVCNDELLLCWSMSSKTVKIEGNESKRIFFKKIIIILNNKGIVL